MASTKNRKEGGFFFRRKKQKDFSPLSGPGAGRELRTKGKSSLVLSFKKEQPFFFVPRIGLGRNVHNTFRKTKRIRDDQKSSCCREAMPRQGFGAWRASREASPQTYVEAMMPSASTMRSRMMYFCTLPVTVMGKESTKRT